MCITFYPGLSDSDRTYAKYCISNAMKVHLSQQLNSEDIQDTTNRPTLPNIRDSDSDCEDSVILIDEQVQAELNRFLCGTSA